MVVSEIITWIASKIWWWILRVLSMIGLDWAKEKYRRKIEGEIDIDKQVRLHFYTDTSFPAASLKFKVSNISEVNLNPKHIVAWIIWRNFTIDKISWNRQEGIFAQSAGVVIYHEIPDLPAKKRDRDFTLYYLLPQHVDFGKDELILRGVIEFDCIFGIVVKNFYISLNLSKEKDEWNKAIDKWKELGKSDRTIISGSGKTIVY